MQNNQYKSMYLPIAQAVTTGWTQIIYQVSNPRAGLMPYLKKVSICNFDSNDTYISIGVCKMWDTLGQSKQWLEYKLFIEKYDITAHKSNSYAIDLDIGIRSGDVLFVDTPSNKLAINIFWLEESNLQ